MKTVYTKTIIEIREIIYENGVKHFELITKLGKDGGYNSQGRVNSSLAKKIAKITNIKIERAERVSGYTHSKEGIIISRPISNNCLLYYTTDNIK